MTETRKQFENIGDGLLVRAPGKINISLLVKGKRADGYHDIESIMAKIDWYDEILIERRTDDGGQKTENVQCSMSNNEYRGETDIELICKGEYEVPEGEENLVWKAARLILETRAEDPTSPEGLRRAGRRQKTEQRTENAEINTGDPSKSGMFQMPTTQSAGETPATLRITLVKNMPAGSGLGSGSSDAAATLLGINKFLNLGLSKKELAGLAAKLGSDVAFFLDGPMAICTGRGEKVKKLMKSEFRVLLFLPNVSSSTKRVYENYRQDEAKFDRLREEINLYIEKKRIDFICSIGANMLQESCFELYGELAELKKRIESLGIRPVALSGSGSAMFCFIGKNQEGTNRNREGEEKREKLERETGCRIIIANNNSW